MTELIKTNTKLGEGAEVQAGHAVSRTTMARCAGAELLT